MVNTEAITNEAWEMIKELSSAGWQFMLLMEERKYFHEVEPERDLPNNDMLWEADFTRQLGNGSWDNHQSGIAVTPTEAIIEAYNNIKQGNRGVYAQINAGN